MDELSEIPFVDLLPNPLKLILPAALVADGEDDTGFAADAGDLFSVRNCVGDRFVEKYRLARLGRRAGGFEVYMVRGGVDDGVDGRVFQDVLRNWDLSSSD